MATSDPRSGRRPHRRLAAGLRWWRRSSSRRRDDGGTPTEDGPLRPAERLLAASPLFDHEWYAGFVGRPLDRISAVRHYLEVGGAEGFTPHPLFDPATFREQYGAERLGSRDPLVVYLRRRAFRTTTHPVFDVKEYLAAVPAALEHRGGPVAHWWDQPPAGRRAACIALPPAVDLPSWLLEQRDAWLARRDAAAPLWTADVQDDTGPAAGDGTAPGVGSAAGPLVTVVLDTRRGGAAPPESLASALDQSVKAIEVLVVGAGAVEVASADPRVRVLGPSDSEAGALGSALDVARGTYVAWMSAGDTWAPDRLERLLGPLAAGAEVVQDVAEDVTPGHTPMRSVRAATRARMRSGARPELSTFVTTTALARRTGFDPSLPNGTRHDHLLRLVDAAGDPHLVPSVGVRIDRSRRAVDPAPNERPWLDASGVDAWHDVVLARALIDWDAVREREVDDDLLSVVVTTYRDWRMTLHAVRSVLSEAERTGDRVEVVVVDNGSDLGAACGLAAAAMSMPCLRVLTMPANLGFALGNDIGLADARGGTVVFLNNDTEVQPGWLAPLRKAMTEPEVLAAQPLLTFPTGTVQSAGVAFPTCGGPPHEMLRGFHVDDASALEEQSFHALTGAALMVRRADAVSLRGFDPVFRNGMEDIDFCLRLGELRPGHMRVVPDSRVVHFESRSPSRFDHAAVNRKLLLDRWDGRMPADDVSLWAACGYTLHGHVPGSRAGKDRRLWRPEPVLSRTRRAPLDVSEPAPRLRWAIKNPAPYGPDGERWGDTHFARQLATALRGLGQEVVIDHHQAFDRASGSFDDVVLVLRGLSNHWPAWGQVNLLWVISHPERVSRREVERYDRVMAASTAWSRRRSREWGVRVDPLLQATDPSVFHPDRAVPDSGHRLLFIGNSRMQLRPLVRDAVEAGLPLSVYGSNWAKVLPDLQVEAPYLANAEVGAAYRGAGFVLNDHWDDMRREGFLSNRLFDAVASGARVVTDDVSGLREVFGSSVQVARSREELVRLVTSPRPDDLFGDDASRRLEAARVHREHSFAARAATLLETALDVRRDRARTTTAL